MFVARRYGEQLLFVTEYVADRTSPSISGEDMSDAMLKWAKSFGGRPDHALTTFIDNIEKESKKFPDCGADDDQAHIYMKIVPVAALHAGKDTLLENVVTAIRVHQNNPTALAFGISSARLLEAVILGAPLEEALETVQKNMSDDFKKAEISDEIQQKVQTAFENGKKYAENVDMKTMDSMLLGEWMTSRRHLNIGFDFEISFLTPKIDVSFFIYWGRFFASIDEG